MKRIAIALSWFAFAFFVAPLVSAQQGALSGPIVRSEPALNEAATAAQGDPVYAEIAEVLTNRVRLLQKVVIDDDLTIEHGTELEYEAHREQPGYCYADGEKRVMGIKSPRDICLYAEKDGTFTMQARQTRGAIIVRRSALKSPIKFEKIRGAAVGPTPFRKEILFSGAAAGVLRLVYREFADDLARPAFTQELTFDLPAADAPMTINVKGARIEITGAGNRGLAYRVVSPFASPSVKPQQRKN